MQNGISAISTGKPIPVHCVVISTTTPSYLAENTHVDYKAIDNGSSNDTTDMDSYAIIPASTLFVNIVPTVLRKLGYSDDSIFNATGNYSKIKC